jgi:acetyl-CoA decarbonylase/synthase complex subunit gamma
LLYAADAENWQKMAEIAKAAKAPLVVRPMAGSGDPLSALAELTLALKQAGVEDVVLDPLARGFGASLNTLTQLRRLALKKSFRALGYPVITFPGEAGGADETLLAAQHVAKYAGFVVLETFDPATLYPLLVLRQNIYTDPQKPLQMDPGLYAIGEPNQHSPLLVTSNFSLTYFIVSTEAEATGMACHLAVVDAEGLSVLTAWSAGKFSGDRVAKALRDMKADERVDHRTVIIPGYVPVISGELEDALGDGWHVLVGPQEASDIAPFFRDVWEPLARDAVAKA